MNKQVIVAMLQQDGSTFALRFSGNLTKRALESVDIQVLFGESVTVPDPQDADVQPYIVAKNDTHNLLWYPPSDGEEGRYVLVLKGDAAE